MKYSFRLMLPVPRLSRSLVALDMDDADRERVALAFLRDTIDATVQSPHLRTGEIYVITGDPAARTAAESADLQVLEPIRSGLPHEVVTAAYQQISEHHAMPTAVLSPLLAALHPRELDQALEKVSSVNRSAFVGDLFGTGSTLFAAHPSDSNPCFGEDAPRLHRATGIYEVRDDLPGLRCAVTTTETLAIAVYMGVGRHTQEALEHVQDLHVRPLATHF